jgi:hypothetical protein
MHVDRSAFGAPLAHWRVRHMQRQSATLNVQRAHFAKLHHVPGVGWLPAISPPLTRLRQPAPQARNRTYDQR